MEGWAPYSVHDVARYVVDKCYRDGNPVSNLQLQKILYFLQLFFVEVFGVLMFPEEFEAWPYGPVMPSVYRRFSRFGGVPIEVSFKDAGSFLSKDHRDVINVAIQVLSKKSPWELVRVSHADGSPWDVVYNRRGQYKGTIPNEMVYGSVRARSHA